MIQVFSITAKSSFQHFSVVSVHHSRVKLQWTSDYLGNGEKLNNQKLSTGSIVGNELADLLKKVLTSYKLPEIISLSHKYEDLCWPEQNW